jgi:hypothetical protein
VYFYCSKNFKQKNNFNFIEMLKKNKLLKHYFLEHSEFLARFLRIKPDKRRTLLAIGLSFIV